MKLKKSHLIIILLLTLIFCCGLGGFKTIEGMENPDRPNTNENNKYSNQNTTTNQNKPKYDYNDYISQSSIHGNGYSNNNYSNIHNTNEQIKTISLDDGRVIYATPQNTINGIPGKNIPPGQEDLYILKSQVVPPVCPACPTVINTGIAKSECPPCPPCGRCPESSFECVKRPTYKPDNPYLPVPVLSDFSAFGM